MMRLTVVAFLMSVATGQLATKDAVETPMLDMARQLVSSLQDSESVEQLEQKVVKAKEARGKAEGRFREITDKDGAVNSKSKLAAALRETAGSNDMLESCIENDSCMDALFARMDANNDGTIDMTD